MKHVAFFVFMSMLPYLQAQHSTLNDEFNSPCNLSDWQNITEVEGWMTPDGVPAEHLEEFDISDSYPGELYMMPYASSWYANWRGVLLFKEVVGDFIITTHITTTQRDGDAIPPASNYSLAGLMVRTPTGIFNATNGGPSGIQNYVFAAMGRARSATQFQLEIKNTLGSGSQLRIHNIGQGNNDIYMRMIRTGDYILVLSSEDNVNWTFRERYNRSDLPDTVQLGFVTYTDWPNVQSVGWQAQNNNILNNNYSQNYSWNPDLIGRFDFARIEEVELPIEYEGANFMTLDTSDIRSIFDHPSLPLFPSGSKIWRGGTSNNWADAANWHGGAPAAGDYVVIPNCSCSEVNTPTISSSTPIFSGFHLEAGGSVVIAEGATLNIDLNNPNASFINEGEISNHGSIIVSNASGKNVTTISSLNNLPGAEFRVEE